MSGWMDEWMDTPTHVQQTHIWLKVLKERGGGGVEKQHQAGETEALAS